MSPARTSRDVVFVDGVRTPFGKAGATGLYAETRADDLVVTLIRELLRRHPELPPERIDEVAIAATTQIGDQGLTIGRSAAILAGLPRSVPGYAIDRMCAGAMTAVTNVSSGIAFGAYDVAIAGGVEHMGHHPMGEGIDPNPRFVAERLVDSDALLMGKTAERLHDRFPQHHPRSGPTPSPSASQDKLAKAYANGKVQPDLVPVATRSVELGLGPGDRRRAAAPRHHRRGAGRPAYAVPAARQRHRRQRRRPQRRRDRVPARGGRDRGRARPRSQDALVGLRLRRRRPRGHGRRPDPLDRESPRAQRADHRRHRAVRAQRGLRGPGAGLPRPLRDRRRRRSGQRVRRRDRVGHPLASSGVRLMTQLARQFEDHPEVRYGLTAMCVGLGQGGTVLWENPHFDGAKN